MIAKIDAAHRYNELAIKYFGEFANVNVFTSLDLQKRLYEKRPPKGFQRKIKSGYKGVYKMSDKCYVAHISVNKKKKHIGCFKTSEEAALAYNNKALELFGENTALNIIPLIK